MMAELLFMMLTKIIISTDIENIVWEILFQMFQIIEY